VDVRVAAIDAVGQLGDHRAVPALIRLVSDTVPRVRTAAVTALGNLGATEAADLLISELRRRSTDAQYPARVAFALGKIGGAGYAPAIEVLVESLADDRLAAAAREALSVAGRAAVPALIAHLDGRLAGDATAAVELLRDAGDPSATPALVGELERGRVPRELVLAALGTCGDERALVPVLGLLGDPDPAVRASAMRALRPLLGPRAADVLIGTLADTDADIRILAAEYLGTIRSRAAVPKLVDAARAGEPMRLRYAAMTSLGAIGDPAALAVLLEVLRDGPAPLRRVAADAIAQLRVIDAVAPHVAMARGGDLDRRAHAVRALGGVLRDRPHAGARTLLLGLAKRGPIAVSLPAIGAIGAMRDPAAEPALIALARDSTLERRRAAVTALGDLGDRAGPAAVAVLLTALTARDDRVKARMSP
jgi:HEAT repeat protein